jgi:hypothetical protein
MHVLTNMVEHNPSAPDRVVSSKKSTHHWWVEFSHTATYN